jgi:DNA-binding NarL/FixJ family response regulator
MDHSDSTVNRRIRVFLLDDHEIVRRGLTELLDSARDMSWWGRRERRLRPCAAFQTRRRNSGRTVARRERH